MSATIPIVDDDSDLRSSLAIILRPDFEVIEASNGTEALDLIKKERPRLTLLDVSMPGMSGLEVLAAAKAAVPAIIVAMLTSQQDIEIAAQALNLGAVEYVAKPFDADYMRAEVSRLVSPGKSADDKPWKAIS
jgi:DNA-binding NtrC family response regulator